MTKGELNTAVAAAKAEVKTAVETILNALNSGQRQKILKNEMVKKLVERNGVKIE